MRVSAITAVLFSLLGAVGLTAEPTSTDSARAVEPGSYEAALIAAVCHWAEEGDHNEALANLRAVLDKHPELTSARQVFRQPRKPVSTDNYTPLHFAARYDRPEVVGCLLGKGADINADGGHGWTPLHLAAQNGNLAIVKLLVEHGADVRAKTAAIPETSSDQLPGQPPPTPGQPRKPPTIYPAVPARTALDWAREAKHADIVQYLESLPSQRRN